MVPTGRPATVARCAWQQSSTIGTPRRCAIRSMAVMSAPCPYRCTGTMARVRAVIACSIRSGSSVRRSASMSTKIGRAPTMMMASAVYAADSGVVMTSSPGPMSRARRMSASASVPLPTPTACAAPEAAANSCSNASSSGPSTNQPLLATRAIAARTASASSRSVSDRNGTRVWFTPDPRDRWRGTYSERWRR